STYRAHAKKLSLSVAGNHMDNADDSRSVVRESNAWLSYLLGLAGVAAGFVGHLLLADYLDGQTKFLFYIPAVLVSSIAGGAVPGLAVTILAATLGILSQESATTSYINAAAFASISAGIAIAGEFQLRNRRRVISARAELIAREAHLQSILNTVPDAMIVIDAGGIVSSFSAAAEKLFGYSANEVIGKNVK